MSWSLTRLQVSESCGAKYKWRYLDHLPEAAKSEAAARGSAKHTLIESYLNSQEAMELPAELAYYKGFLDALKSHSCLPEHRIALDADWNKCDWDAPEAELKSVLDLLSIGELEATIYDWKSGKIYPDHADQRELYALAVFCAYPTVQTIRTIHVYIDLAKNREATYFRGMLEVMKAKWMERVNKMRAMTEFIPNPTYKCRWCGYSRYNGGPCQF